MRVLAIDVGIRNLAFCCLEDGCLLAWANEPLAGAEYKPTDTVHHVMRFVEAHRQLFDSCDKLVIERQMRVNMRVVEAALHALFYAKCTIVHARTIKARFGLCKRNYQQNKAAAVACVDDLLAGNTAELAAAYRAARKRDDLADAYLMALFFSDGEQWPTKSASRSPSQSPPPKRSRMATTAFTATTAA
jgi:Poxvirus A22 protein